MDHPTRRLDQPDEPPDNPTQRLDAADAPPAAPPARLPDPVPPPAGRSTGLCPECGGPMLIMRVRLGTSDVVVERLAASARELLIHQAAKAKGRSPLEARVCIECGFAKLYAANLAQLLE
jgi:hypothetical protein